MPIKPYPAKRSKGRAANKAGAAIVGRRQTAKERQLASRERFVRPLAKEHVEPLRMRLLNALKASAMNPALRKETTRMLKKYHAFYSSWRGDILGVCKELDQTHERHGKLEFGVDIVKPGETPARYGSGIIYAYKGSVSISLLIRSKRGEEGAQALPAGLLRIILDEALRVRKRGQPITVVSTEEAENLYKRYGFRFKDPASGKGVLSAEDIERGTPRTADFY